MLVGVIALLVVLIVVGVAATVLRAREGTVSPGVATDIEPERPAETTLTDRGLESTLVEDELPGPGGALPDVVRAAVQPAAAVTLVQLSTRTCSSCGPARTLLADVARRTQGVAHAEVDISERVDVARDLHVLRTPTTLALDPRGTELFRISGMPKPDRLAAALHPHLRRPR